MPFELAHCECGAIEGDIHKFGCDMERCSQCAGQFISCDCPEPLQDRARAPFILFPLMCNRCGVHWPEFFDVVDEVWQHYILQLGQGDKLLCLGCFNSIVMAIDEGEFESEHDGIVMLKDMKATSPVGSPGRIRWEQKRAKNRALWAAQFPETEEPT